MVAMMLPQAALWSADGAFQVRADISEIPDAAVYAESAKAICEEWYPKINVILYGKDHPLPFAEVELLFAGVVVAADGSEQKEVPALSKRNKIWISLEHCKSHYPTSDPALWPRGFQAMMIHELTHVNQDYGKYPSNASWVTEGIADYVRHKCFEEDIEPRLRLDSHGQLNGYSPKDNYLFALQNRKAELDSKGYLLSYTVASAFLFWIEERKDKEVIRKLNAALHNGKYSERVFEQSCGAPLDALWREFLVQSKP